MRTARSSSLWRGRGALVLIPLNSPLGCWPGPDPPEFPPWVWAWTWSPWISPLGVGLDLIPLNFPLGCGPGSDPPEFPPWVWAWIWSPWISPLGMGLDLIPLNFPLGCGPGPDPPQFPPWCGPGGSPWQEGVSLVGGLLSRRGVSLAGGLLGRGSPWRGVSLAGGSPCMHWGRSPLVNRMTNRCKNITLPQTSFAGGKYHLPTRWHIRRWPQRPNIAITVELRCKWRRSSNCTTAIFANILTYCQWLDWFHSCANVVQALGLQTPFWMWVWNLNFEL